MPTVVLNGTPDQEFPDEQELEAIDFQQVAHELSVATDRLKDRSDTMETKYKILSTRLAAAEAATTHLNNQLEVVRTENAALRDRMATIERIIPPSETDVHQINRDIDLLNRKIHALDSEFNKRWFERILEYFGFRKDYASIDDVSNGV